MDSLLNIEEHPLEPFLPANAVLLMLGSFPPQKKRWSMDFFYPNLQNDMWRIVGLIFFQDKEHFLNPEKKVFDKDRIIEFLNDKGIALYDTASAIRRLQDNASDKFLEVIEQTDISLLLKQIPMCKAIVTTGQKATDIIREQIEVKEPTVGTSEPFEFGDKAMKLYRMPSSSRAYPLALEKKAAAYRVMFNELGLHKAGYNLIIATSGNLFEREKKIIASLSQGKVVGIIAAVAAETTDYSHYVSLVESGIPLVMFDRKMAIPNTSSVVQDDYNGAYEATKHLIEQGCKRIFFYRGPQNVSIWSERDRGYRQAMSDYGLEVTNKHIHKYSFRNAAEATTWIIHPYHLIPTNLF